MRSNYLKSIVYTLLFFAIQACNPETGPEPELSGTYSEGVLVVNGGNFSQNNGTFTFLNREEGEVITDLYNRVNGNPTLPPADGRIEGYTEAGSIGLILFDNMSGGLDKLVFVDAGSFEKKSELGAPHFENPRDVVAVNPQKAYITNWDSFNDDWSYKEGFITVVNPESGSVLKKIEVGQAPENMVLHQNKVYIGRAESAGHDLVIVNTATDAVTGKINFESRPNPIGIDASGRLWVSEGNRFHKINTSTDQIESTIPAGAEASRPIGISALTADGTEMVFVLNSSDWGSPGAVYQFNLSSPVINIDKPFTNLSFSALGWDSKSELIYGGLTPSYTQSGYVYRFRSTGALVDSVKAEISPESFYFKQTGL